MLILNHISLKINDETLQQQQSSTATGQTFSTLRTLQITASQVELVESMGENLTTQPSTSGTTRSQRTTRTVHEYSSIDEDDDDDVESNLYALSSSYIAESNTRRQRNRDEQAAVEHRAEIRIAQINDNDIRKEIEQTWAINEGRGAAKRKRASKQDRDNARLQIRRRIIQEEKDARVIPTELLTNSL